MKSKKSQWNSLQRFRALTGLTQGQLALKAGVDRVTIANTESGRNRPYLATLGKLANALDSELAQKGIRVSIDDLADLAQDNSPEGE